MERPSFFPYPATFLGILLLAGGCGNSFLGNRVNEGTIEYALSFPDLDPNGLMSGMLPEKTTLSFDKEHQSMDLSAGMGIFRTSMVVNTPSQVVDYHMSVMGKNLVAELRPRDLLTFNQTPSALTVLYTGATDTIAGFACKKAVLIYSDMDLPEQEVWYTDEIDMDMPNWYGPFKDIPGVLMRYEFTQNNVRMRLEATSVKPGAVEASKFQVQPDHDRVSPEVLYAQLDEVLGTLGR
jgi:GLPGLI family protein